MTENAELKKLLSSAAPVNCPRYEKNGDALLDKDGDPATSRRKLQNEDVLSHNTYPDGHTVVVTVWGEKITLDTDA